MEKGLNEEAMESVRELWRRYTIDRDKAVETLDIEVFKDFVNKYISLGLLPKCFSLAEDNVLEITIRKMAFNCLSISPETKEKAKDWLLERGYSLEL